MSEATTTAEHPVLVALHAALEGLMASSGWSRSLDELRAEVDVAAEARALVESFYLVSVAHLDPVESAAAPGARRGPHATKNYLAQRFRLDPAAAFADVQAARALFADDADLGQVRDALVAGRVTRRHVDEAVKVHAHVRAHVLAATAQDGTTGAQAVDTFLADAAAGLTPTEVAGAGRALLGRFASDPDDADHASDVRRAFTLGVAPDGCGLFRGVVPPSDVPWVKALVDRWSTPRPDGVGVDRDGQETLFPDTRTADQRRYDGLVATLRSGLTADGENADGPTPDVVVLITASVDDLDPGKPCSATVDGLNAISRPVFERLACTATLHRVMTDPNGAVLDLGRGVRLATPAQRKALAARDGGCAIPGCTTAARACDAHHAVAWSAGGPSDLGNLVLLCPAHHTDVHLDLWQVHLVDGIPWTTSPTWLSGDRTPRRNPRHHHDHTARTAGDQLRLAVHPRTPRSTVAADGDPP